MPVAKSTADFPAMFTKNPLMPSGSSVSDAWFPYRSTMELFETPTTAMISFNTEATTEARATAVVMQRPTLGNSIVMRALPSGKHEVFEHCSQSDANLEPGMAFHVPLGQTLQSVDSNSSWYVPAGHVTQAAAPVAGPNFEGGQRKQTVELACPLAGWYVPAVHSWQAPGPVAPQSEL